MVIIRIDIASLPAAFPHRAETDFTHTTNFLHHEWNVG
ncbi:Uncharacterised protein [Vibrio cholerae]|nr:Uncharacterised protein [Vibrio cholerae]CSI66543.1 Uncharacterised protein [Vibrio cholerae]